MSTESSNSEHRHSFSEPASREPAAHESASNQSQASDQSRASDQSQASNQGRTSDQTQTSDPEFVDVSGQVRDIAEVAAVEVITTTAVHLMSAAAVKVGLAEGEDADELKDLDEARKLIIALAGLVTASAPEIGSQHAGPLRDGLRSLQLAFREASLVPDAPGQGPGEKYTGPVN